MSDPNKIREAVQHERDMFFIAEVSEVIHDAALAYADSLEHPMDHCFEHGYPVEDDGVCIAWVPPDWPQHTPCDIAKATRPRRIET